jgi:DNA-directed RNA polymerase II subunit RPB2
LSPPILTTEGPPDESMSNEGPEASPAEDNDVLEEPVQYMLIRSAIEHSGLVPHMIHSYNCFVTEMLPRILEEHSLIITRGRREPVEHRIRIIGTAIELPSVREFDGTVRRITYTEAKLRGLNYASNVCVDVEHSIASVVDGIPGEAESCDTWRALPLCLIPTMVGSVLCSSTQGLGNHRECPMDSGGYFVFNGNDKAILAQEKLKTNTIFVFPGKYGTKLACTCEIRSCHEAKMRSTSTLYIHCTQSSSACIPSLTATVPFITVQIPIAHLFVLLGCETLTDMLDYCVGSAHDGGGVVSAKIARLAVAVIENSFDGLSVAAVQATIAKGCTRHKTAEGRARYMDHIITHEVLPHVGINPTPEVLHKKRLFLGLMVRRAASVLVNESAPDDRDTYANKRIDTAGMLMSLLFRQLMRRTVKHISQQIHRSIEHQKAVVIPDILKMAKITSGFRYAFGSGNWGTQSKGPATQSGVVQTLTACNIVSSWANLRRINTPINREGKAPKPRQLHSSSWRRVCPVETPEGGSCGLVKNLALLCHVRMLCPVGQLVDVLWRYARCWVVPIEGPGAATPDTYSSHIPMHLNGIVHGFVAPDDVDAFLVAMRLARRRGALPYDCSVYQQPTGLHVESDAGCLLSPVLELASIHRMPELVARHPPGGSASLWAELVQEGLIQYVDNSEEQGLRVAQFSRDLPGVPRYTHIEIHPSLINGLCASIIPFSHHNQAPRNCYQVTKTTLTRSDSAVSQRWESRLSGSMPAISVLGWMSSVTCSTTQRLLLSPHGWMTFSGLTGYHAEEPSPLRSCA